MSVVMSAVICDPECAGATPCCSPSASPTSRVRADDLDDTQRNFSIAMHLSPFAAAIAGPPAFLIPVVLWLIRKDRSAFNDDHGREIVNFMISFVLWHLILGVTVIGLALIPVLWVVGVVNVVRASIAASNGEFFRYPMTFRFLS